MPRKPTQESETNKWIKANSDWLGPDHAPMVQQLRALAATQDAELAQLGRVQAATASAYRMAYRTIMEYKPLEQRQREALEAEDDALMEPAAWM